MSSVQEEDCVLCCCEIKIYAVGACDHPVCNECSTRMRVLCETNECPICRSDVPLVAFTHEKNAFIDIPKKVPIHLLNKKYQILFQDEIVARDFERLLENRCKSCDEVFESFEKLKEHVRRKHELHFCDLCSDSLKIFTSERKSYSRKDLARHKRLGDPDETSHRGHPICEFCDLRYVDSDELFRHLRREHFFCHFCDADGNNQYYKDYEYLKTHFRREHFLCEEDDCVNEKFTAVFRSDIDLRAHIAVHHTKNKSKKEVKQARLLDFEFAPPPRHTGNSSPRGGRYAQRRRNGDENSSREKSKTEPQPEVESLDTQSVQDFPYLSGDVTNKNNQTENSSLELKLQSSLNLQSYSRRPPPMSVDDFPALCSSKAVDVSTNQNKVTGVNMNQYNNTLQAAAVSLQTKRNVPNHSSDKSRSKKNLSDNSNRPQQKWNGTKESPKFEDDFPFLEVRSKPQPPINRPPLISSESKSNLIKDITKDSHGDQFVVLKSKSKKKPNKNLVQPETEIEKQYLISMNSKPSEVEDKDQFKKHLIHPLERKQPPTTRMSGCWVEEASFGTEDFPPLAVTDKPLKKPPGLIPKKPQVPPPGFSAIKPKIEPAPTMENLLSSMKERFMASQNKQNGNDQYQSSNNISSDEEVVEKVYKAPPNFELRSTELIRRIEDLTEDNFLTFNEFKRVSGKFRNEAITANEYYSQCLDILGSRFLDIFPELISLLPDIKLQQKLLTVHNKYASQGNSGAISKKTSACNNAVVSCDVCSQVLIQSDCRSHNLNHQ